MGLPKSRWGRGHPAGRPGAPGPALEELEARTLPDAAANQAFVNQAYQDLLRRPADAGGLALYGGALDAGGLSRLQAALALETSPEYHADEVAGLINYYLMRAPDPVGLAALTAVLDAGGTLEQVEADLLGSAEYFQNRGGGSNDGFLDALYRDTLGRPIDPAAQAALDGLLAKGESRTAVAAGVLASPEHRQALVGGYYQEFLGRAADPSGLAAFTAALGAGTRDEVVVAGLVGSDEFYFALDPPSQTSASTTVLTPSDVGTLLDRAAAAAASDDGIVAVVDRDGRILGVRVEGNVSPAITGNVGNLVFAIDGAAALARTGAFFASNQAPLTSRTVRDLSQSVNTQREVQSNPTITDPNSPFRGPGFVAPIDVGGHFPPYVMFTPAVDLFDIEHTNRDSIINPGPDHIKGTADDNRLPNRFNVPDQFIPSTIPVDQRLVPPESYGFVSGLMPNAQARGIGTLPGGIPLYKDGTLVGGIGVFFPGTTGFASEENSVLGAEHNPVKPDRSLEAEYVAFAAAGGSAAASFPSGPLGGVAPLPGFDLPFGRIDLVGVTLDIYGPGGLQGPQNLVSYGLTLGTGNPHSGVNEPVAVGPSGVPGGADAVFLQGGVPVPDGWLVTPHAGGGLTAQDVTTIIQNGIIQANQTRAAIRLPLGSRARMVFAVTDNDGNVLGLYRMPDATVFSLDVAVAKARNVAYYANPAQLQSADEIPGIPPGVAFTNRTFRYVSQPRFPEGIDGSPPGPFSILNDGGADPVSGRLIGPRQPASAFQSVEGYDAFNPQTNFHDPYNVANQNGIVFFPGSAPLYKVINGVPQLVGGLGVSGDGVDQDDVVTFAASAGYGVLPPVLRADQVSVNGVNLPYQKFNRNPEG
jgi:uncharacterized protein GlcG (DUF336 family)